MYKICGITDKGLVYKHNEDCFMINERVYFDRADIDMESEAIIAAVADGVGGENAGEIASKMCLEKLALMDKFISLDGIKDYIQRISQEISDYALQKTELAGMATTLAGVICSNERFIIFNVGNSRVYRYRNGNLRQFSIDDTLVQIMFESGQIKREEIANHPNKNVILQAIGQEKKNSSIDVHIHLAKNPLEKGDILLICTDGLSDLVTNNEIEKVMEDNTEIGIMAEELVKYAKAADGNDNITLLIIEKQ